jgi:hypothetical protein
MQEPTPQKILITSELNILNENTEIYGKQIIVGVSLHNNAHTIKRCIDSVIFQDIFELCAIIILDDLSNDDWVKEVEYALKLSNILVIRGNCGSPARSRNTILDFVDNHFKNPKWIARLDADDKFTTQSSLSMMCTEGDKYNSSYVIGGNRLIYEGQLLDKINYASSSLFNKDNIIQILNDMSNNSAYNELPSCNLVLKANSGFRYPDISSAEDHWLLTELLFYHSNKGIILEEFLYCDYTLNGNTTSINKQNNTHQKNRLKLYQTILIWNNLNTKKVNVLGYGMEGIVIQEKELVKKYFYPDIISEQKIKWINSILVEENDFIPKSHWIKKYSSWVCTYDYFDSQECKKISKKQIKDFLLFCLSKKIVCTNIKRANFRIRNKKLVYIDIGTSIIPMDIRYFIDSVARLYCISILNYKDYELLRRNNKNNMRQEDILNQIPDFYEFYNDLMQSYSKSNWNPFIFNKKLFIQNHTNECTLMIKVCAMDYDLIIAQVKYIVANLEVPTLFFEKVLLIDSNEDNFLRQYQKPDLQRVIQLASKLKENNIINRVLISPTDINEIKNINNKWFGLNCAETHSYKKVPIFPQIWGFEQLHTRYVLQCDIDILIGKKTLSHDYLKDMLSAIKQKDVVGVAFNIPFEFDKGFRKYEAPYGDYVPEVRCGLLDLKRIKTLHPLPNEIKEEKLLLSWFRSLHESQKQNKKKTLRGGDPKTFYIHPENNWKKNIDKLFEIQDLVNQVKIPTFQYQKWDLEGSEEMWDYPKRNEEIVFLMKGKNTEVTKINRCFASLKMQSDQEFGMIVIDDNSDNYRIELISLLESLEDKTTLIRNYKNKGRIPNFIKAIEEICINNDSLIVILDLDDALIDIDIVTKLKKYMHKGHDLIQGGMFRPNKALKIYIPSYENCRKKFGANVWSHLRAFKKSLFGKINKEQLKIDDNWIQECTDYATMIPLVELSEKPIFISEYWYLHENSTLRTNEIQFKKNNIIKKILTYE